MNVKMDEKQREVDGEDAPPPYLPPEMEPMTAMYPKGAENPPGYAPAPPGYPNQQSYPMQVGYTAPPGYPVGQQPLYVTNQQAPVAVYMSPNAAMPSPPPTNLGLAIFVTLCCCWPIGIFAILRSASCKNAIGRGDRHTATRLSHESRMLSMWALGIGIAFNVLSIAVFVTMYALYIIPSWQERGVFN